MAGYLSSRYGAGAAIALLAVAGAACIWLAVIRCGRNAADYAQSGTGTPGEIFDDWDRTVSRSTAPDGPGDIAEMRLDFLFEPLAAGGGEERVSQGGAARGLVEMESRQGPVLFSMNARDIEEYYRSLKPAESMGIMLPGGWKMTFAPGERLKGVFGQLLEDPGMDVLRAKGTDVMGGVLEGLNFELKLSF